MKQSQVCGYILHSRKFGDTSLIVDLLSHDDVRDTFMCKGVYRPRSRFCGVLQPFTELCVDYRQRQGMPLITEASAVSNLPFQNSKSMYCGFYLNELMTLLVKAKDAHEGIYSLYRATLKSLQMTMEIEPVLRRFEKELLALLGYELELSREALGGPSLKTDMWYDYRLGHGPVVCSEVALPSTNGYRVSGDCLLALAANDYSGKQTLAEAKGLLRYILNHHLDGRPLRSRDLFRSCK